jgi:uracil-DNA glycosylase
MVRSPKTQIEIELALEAIKERMIDAKLPLCDTAMSIVFGSGSFSPKILFIGEAPGKKEDESGEPFVGSAGKQLNTYLASIGLHRDDCYITNIVKYRPPQNRDPTQVEIEAHTPFLVEQIRVLRPTIIVTLGRFSTAFVLAHFSCDKKRMKQILPITQTHGELHTLLFEDMEMHVVPCFHPAASLYNPKLRETIFTDFAFIASVLQRK